MGKHYNRKSQEKLCLDLMNECNVYLLSHPKPSILSNYQLMCMINKYLKRLNLTPYTEEELEMDLN